MDLDETFRQAEEALRASQVADNTAALRRKELRKIVRHLHYDLRIPQSIIAKRLGKHPNTIANWCAEKD